MLCSFQQEIPEDPHLLEALVGHLSQIPTTVLTGSFRCEGLETVHRLRAQPPLEKSLYFGHKLNFMSIVEGGNTGTSISLALLTVQYSIRDSVNKPPEILKRLHRGSKLFLTWRSHCTAPPK